MTSLFALAIASMLYAPLVNSPAPVGVLAVQKNLISAYAEAWGVSRAEMDYLVKCESGYHSEALNDRRDATTSPEYSVGLVQLNLLAHPEITEHEARDAGFSLNYLGRYMAAGDTRQWLTCSRKWRA